MCAGAILTAISEIATLAQSGSWHSEIHKAYPKWNEAKITSLMSSLTEQAVISGIVGTALWVWMAWACNRGHNWARIVSTVLFGLYSVMLVENVASEGSAVLTTVSALPDLVNWVIGLVTVVTLWRPESTDYFKGYG